MRHQKDVHDTHGVGLHLLYHNESKPQQRPASANKLAAGMLTDSWQAYKKKEQKGMDWFTGSTTKKSSNSCMFKSSLNLYGDHAHEPKQTIARGHSAQKKTELIGTSPAKAMPESAARRQEIKHAHNSSNFCGANA